MTKNIYPKWLFKIKNGQLLFEDKKGFDKYLANNFEDKIGEIIAKPHRKGRSSGQVDEDGNQNGYYWGVIVTMVAEEMGVFKDEAHDFLRHKFLVQGKTVGAVRFEIARSTADLNTIEFEDYCEKIRIWASMPGNLCEMGLYIPKPHEAAYDI